MSEPTPRERVWVPAAEVRIGDQLAHKLSDTPWTYTEVTGWTDKYLATSDVTHRTFTVTGAPWWVDDMDRTSDLAGQALIRARPGDPPQYDQPRDEPAESDDMATQHGDECPNHAAGIACDCGCESEPEPVTRVIMTDDYYGYRMPVPSAFGNDIMASDDDKWATLESIGVTRRDDVSPLTAWRDAVADETGIPRAELDPAQGGRFDLGFTPAYVREFVFYLA